VTNEQRAVEEVMEYAWNYLMWQEVSMDEFFLLLRERCNREVADLYNGMESDEDMETCDE
jgi:hypothetical protein